MSLAKVPGAFEVSPGDEGGLMNGSGTYDGTIQVGDLDLWRFAACAKEQIVIRIEELTGGISFAPWIRLYGRDGTLVDSKSGAAGAQMSLQAPASGNYVVVVADGLSGLGGSGTYRLIAEGLTAATRMCPSKVGGAMVVDGAGGDAGLNYIVVTAYDVATPLHLWVPIYTNTVGTFGEFRFTNHIDPAILQQYYLLVKP